MIPRRSTPFVPRHINAVPGDLNGNGGIGRYVLLPGSAGRAREIAARFEGLESHPHERSHNLYLGRIALSEGRRIDVATVSTGMGCASLDIIVNELFHLGAKRFLRVGTAGSLQPERVHAGQVVVATASVRDEHTSRVYVPVEFPAVASLEMIHAAERASAALGWVDEVHFGIVHCKSSLFAREFGEGPMARQNRDYMDLLVHSGTLASEMETSQLFVLSSLYDYELRRNGHSWADRALAGAVLGIVGDDRPFGSPDVEARAVERSIDLAFETLRQLAASESGCHGVTP